MAPSGLYRHLGFMVQNEFAPVEEKPKVGH